MRRKRVYRLEVEAYTRQKVVATTQTKTHPHPTMHPRIVKYKVRQLGLIPTSRII